MTAVLANGHPEAHEAPPAAEGSVVSAPASLASSLLPPRALMGSDVDHMRALYVQTPATLTGYVLGMVVIAMLFWGLAEPWKLFGWLAAVGVLWFVRLAH